MYPDGGPSQAKSNYGHDVVPPPDAMIVSGYGGACATSASGTSAVGHEGRSATPAVFLLCPKLLPFWHDRGPWVGLAASLPPVVLNTVMNGLKGSDPGSKFKETGKSACVGRRVKPRFENGRPS